MAQRVRMILGGRACACACVAVPLLGAVMALCGLAASPALAAGTAQMRLGSRLEIPAGSSLVGALAPSTPMRVTVALEPRDPAALLARAAAVSDPSSALFRHYLTPVQFRRAYGPTTATVAAVRSSLRSLGLHVGALSAGGLTLPVSGDAGTLQHALSLVFDRIRLPTGATAVVNSLAPALDRSI